MKLITLGSKRAYDENTKAGCVWPLRSRNLRLTNILGVRCRRVSFTEIQILCYKDILFLVCKLKIDDRPAFPFHWKFLDNIKAQRDYNPQKNNTANEPMR